MKVDKLINYTHLINYIYIKSLFQVMFNYGIMFRVQLCLLDQLLSCVTCSGKYLMNNNENMTFIDLFAGCGGLSLGLINAGFKGVFAIEKTPDAFSTLIYNLKNQDKQNNFDWPSWLPCKNMTTEELLNNYKDNLKDLEGKVDLIAGGPPCQGFSFAGRRNPNDPRNKLTEEYIKIVDMVKPKFLLLENVRGFQIAFKNKKKAYSEYVISKLENLDGCKYKVFKKVLPASMFGVPQLRHRFIMLAIRHDVIDSLKLEGYDDDSFFEIVNNRASLFKKNNGLKSEIVKLSDAISDLEMKGKKLIKCPDSNNFKQISYQLPDKINPYLKLMRRDVDDKFIPNSLRLPNHKEDTLDKFKYIIQHAEKGKALSKKLKEKFSMKKQCFTVLSPDKLATTITTLPDDALHYSEPRVLTVRENARIQSFPDWFEFQGKYTTGGHRRKEECPRYSQVGNAVPPLMAEVLGLVIKDLTLEK